MCLHANENPVEISFDQSEKKKKFNFILTSTRIFESPEKIMGNDWDPLTKFLNIARRSLATLQSTRSLSISTVRFT